MIVLALSEYSLAGCRSLFNVIVPPHPPGLINAATLPCKTERRDVKDIDRPCMITLALREYSLAGCRSLFNVIV